MLQLRLSFIFGRARGCGTCLFRIYDTKLSYSEEKDLQKENEVVDVVVSSSKLHILAPVLYNIAY